MMLEVMAVNRAWDGVSARMLCSPMTSLGPMRPASICVLPLGTVALTTPVAMTNRLSGTSSRSSTTSPAAYCCATMFWASRSRSSALRERKIFTSSSKARARVDGSITPSGCREMPAASRCR
ncbi:hypothetical protein D3C78_1541990 [compost metagenome]